jgi:threonine/homoserine/homoserine lactone efflux protein
MLWTILSPAPELIAFVILVAATPGPLNLTLLSLGLGGRRRFGWGVILGSAVSYGALYAISSSAARQIAEMNPVIFEAMQLVAASLLLFLAWKIATSRPATKGIAGVPEASGTLAGGAAAGVAICGMGGKSWSSALSAGVLFCDGALSPLEHAVQFGGLATLMVLLFCSPWLLAGVALGRRLTSPRALRAVNVASGGILASLAALMVAA